MRKINKLNKGRKILSLSKGFTLIETLVSISIFTVSILAVLAILSQSIANTGYAKRKIIAAYLAGEGVEYIRNLRDTYVLYSSTPGAGWNAFNTRVGLSSNTVCASENGCYFDDKNISFSDTSMPMTDLILTPCSSSTCSNGALLYDPLTGKYGYETGISSGYTRQIRVESINANETKISSTIYWAQGSGADNVTFSDNLFNWIE